MLCLVPVLSVLSVLSVLGLDKGREHEVHSATEVGHATAEASSSSASLNHRSEWTLANATVGCALEDEPSVLEVSLLLNSWLVWWLTVALSVCVHDRRWRWAAGVAGGR